MDVEDPENDKNPLLRKILIVIDVSPTMLAGEKPRKTGYALACRFAERLAFMATKEPGYSIHLYRGIEEVSADKDEAHALIPNVKEDMSMRGSAPLADIMKVVSKELTYRDFLIIITDAIVYTGGESFALPCAKYLIIVKSADLRRNKKQMRYLRENLNRSPECDDDVSVNMNYVQTYYLRNRSIRKYTKMIHTFVIKAGVYHFTFGKIRDFCWLYPDVKETYIRERAIRVAGTVKVQAFANIELTSHHTLVQLPPKELARKYIMELAHRTNYNHDQDIFASLATVLREDDTALLVAVMPENRYAILAPNRVKPPPGEEEQAVQLIEDDYEEEEEENNLELHLHFLPSEQDWPNHLLKLGELVVECIEPQNNWESIPELNTLDREVLPGEKKPSYARQNHVWTTSEGVCNDMQKVCRHMRKLPERLHLFNREIEKMLRYARVIGVKGVHIRIAKSLRQQCQKYPPLTQQYVEQSVRWLLSLRQ